MIQPGTRLGNYEVVRTIGSGGMGVVYEARHAVLGTSAALKLLLPNLSAHPSVRDRFLQEGYIQHELLHPNIVRVFDAIDTDGWLGLALELVQGPSLEEYAAQRTGPWPLEDTLVVVDAITRAMAYAHERGVVHRDLKPGNVLVPTVSYVPQLANARVTDFGIARMLSNEVRMTAHEAQMGTVPYMAPEQYRAAADAGAPADVFAIGMIAWRLLAGGLPVAAEDLAGVHEMYAGTRPIPKVATIRPDVPAPIGQAIDMALAIDPVARPTTAGQLRALLASAAPGHFTTDPGASGPQTPRPPSAASNSAVSVTPPPRSTPPVVTAPPQVPTTGVTPPVAAVSAQPSSPNAATILEAPTGPHSAPPLPQMTPSAPPLPSGPTTDDFRAQPPSAVPIGAYIAGAVAIVLIGGLIGYFVVGGGSDDGGSEEGALVEDVITPTPERAGPPQASVALGGACTDSVECAAGTCVNQACTVTIPSNLWAVGNRWVFRKTSSSPVEEHRNYDYRYVREVRETSPDPSGGTRIEFAIIGGRDSDDTETYIARGPCMFHVGRRETSQLWCLPTATSMWSSVSWLGTDVRAAEFMSDTDYMTRFAPDLGWLDFHKTSSDRTQSYVVEGIRLGSTRRGDADAIPPLCDWDAHDTRDEPARFVARPDGRREREFARVLGGVGWAREMHVGTDSGAFPRRFYAVTDGNRTAFPRGDGYDLQVVDGAVVDLGAWVDPATNIEHVIVLTRVLGGWKMHHVTSQRPYPRTYNVRGVTDELEPDPFPTMTGCVMRLAARHPNDDTSQIADFDVSTGELRRIGGSLFVQ